MSALESASARSSATMDSRPFTVRRLHRNLRTLVAASKRMKVIPPDQRVDAALRRHGFDDNQVATAHIYVDGVRVTVICIPSRMWHAANEMARLRRVKTGLAHNGLRVMLIPEAFIQREPRLGTSRAIEEATGVHVSMADRSAVLEHLLARGGRSTLIRCASVVKNPVPIHCVLAMFSRGILNFDIGRRGLSADTIVTIDRGAFGP